MGEKVKKSKTSSLSPAKTMKPKEKIMATRKTIWNSGETSLISLRVLLPVPIGDCI